MGIWVQWYPNLISGEFWIKWSLTYHIFKLGKFERLKLVENHEIWFEWKWTLYDDDLYHYHFWFVSLYNGRCSLPKLCKSSRCSLLCWDPTLPPSSPGFKGFKARSMAWNPSSVRLSRLLPKQPSSWNCESFVSIRCHETSLDPVLEAVVSPTFCIPNS